MLLIAPKPEKIVDFSQIPGLYSWPEKVWFRANMVQTLDGSIIDSQGKIESITNDVDKIVFRTLRQLSDVIIIGSNTAMKNQYEDIKISESNQEIRKKLKLQLKPRLAIVSNNLNISQDFLKNWKESEQPIIYTHKQNESKVNNLIKDAEIFYCGQREINLRKVKQDLVSRSFKRILCEGGSQLLSSMFKANLIDELDLTLQVKLSQVKNALKITQGHLFNPAIELKPIQVIQHERTLLLRYLVDGHRL